MSPGDLLPLLAAICMVVPQLLTFAHAERAWGKPTKGTITRHDSITSRYNAPASCVS
jgi:hypothetical protein